MEELASYWPSCGSVSRPPSIAVSRKGEWGTVETGPCLASQTYPSILLEPERAKFHAGDCVRDYIYILFQVVFPEIHLRTERRKDDGREFKACGHDALVNVLKGNGCSRLSCGKLGGGVLGR